MNGIIEIAQHRLLLGDITAGVVGVLMGDDRADVVYSDPPWGRATNSIGTPIGIGGACLERIGLDS